MKLTVLPSVRGRNEDFHGFKCPDCFRVYVMAKGTEQFGYRNYIDGDLELNIFRQLCCPQHEAPLYIAFFDFRWDDSQRIWHCPEPRCHYERTTTGERYLFDEKNADERCA